MKHTDARPAEDVDPHRPGSAARGVTHSSHSTLHSRDDARAQFSRRDDRVDRTHLAGALHVVHGFEFRGHLAELVRTYRGPGVGELYPQAWRVAASSVLAASCASRSLTAGSAAVRLFTSR